MLAWPNSSAFDPGDRNEEDLGGAAEESFPYRVTEHSVMAGKLQGCRVRGVQGQRGAGSEG